MILKSEIPCERSRLSVTVFAFLGIYIVLAMVSHAWAQVASEVLAVAPAISPEKISWISGGLALLLQIAKSDVLGGVFAKVDSKYQPAVVLLLGQLGALVESVASGKKLSVAAVEWLLASGNAMALYTVVMKPFKKKKAPVPAPSV